MNPGLLYNNNRVFNEGGSVMYSLYQIEIPILGEPSELQEGFLHNIDVWVKQVQSVFGGKLKLKSKEKLLSKYIYQNSLMREWNKVMRYAFDDFKGFTLEGYKIVHVMPLYNRYELVIYLQIFFEGKITDYTSLNRFQNPEKGTKDINPFKEYLKKTNVKFDDGHAYRYMEKTELFSSKIEGEYNEQIFLCNPVYIHIEDNYENISWFKLNDDTSDCCNMNFDIRITKEDTNIDKFKRGVNVEYLYKHKDFSHISQHYKSLHIFFHRAANYVNEYKEIDDNLFLLYSISEKVNRIWGKGGVYLMSLDSIKERKEFNEAYYKIMELNTLMDGEITAIKSKFKSLDEKYDRQFERVWSNIITNTQELDKQHQFMYKLLTTPISTRKDLLKTIKEFKEPTDLQVKRLKGLFDAKSSIFMESTMFALTIIVAFWGLLSFYYSSIFSSLNVAQYQSGIAKFSPPVLSVFVISSFILMMYFISIRPKRQSEKFPLLGKKIIRYQENLDFNLDLQKEIKEYKKAMSINPHSEIYIVKLLKIITMIMIYKIYHQKEFDYKTYKETVDNLDVK